MRYNSITCTKKLQRYSFWNFLIGPTLVLAPSLDYGLKTPFSSICYKQSHEVHFWFILSWFLKKWASLVHFSTNTSVKLILIDPVQVRNTNDTFIADRDYKSGTKLHSWNGLRKVNNWPASKINLGSFFITWKWTNYEPHWLKTSVEPKWTKNETKKNHTRLGFPDGLNWKLLAMAGC